MGRLRWLTAGESHGKGLIGIIEGLPAGLQIDEQLIVTQLTRRQHGHGRGKRMKIETDHAEIYTGVRLGKTLGSPIALVLPNKDWSNWAHIMPVEATDKSPKPITLPRPGHGDLAGAMKFGTADIRNILERASARETAMRVALGTIARELLSEVGIQVGSRVIGIGNVTDSSSLPQDLKPNALNEIVDDSPVRVFDRKLEGAMTAAIDEAKEAGDSVGGTFQVIAAGVPYGLGSHTQWDLKLKAKLGQAILSINAIEGVEIGYGFKGGAAFGSAYHDEIVHGDDGRITRLTNHAGGIESGISNAQPIVIQAVMKPIPTLTKPLRSVDIVTGQPGLAHKERTDACAVPAAAVVAESMVCLTIAEELLDKFGGDSLDQLQAHMAATAKY
ncbi:chorismate synthase [Candidatus Neomarinimicrobiota bacterium]